MNVGPHIFVALAIGASALSVDAMEVNSQPVCLVSAAGIGPIRLGMTLLEAKAAMPTTNFKRSSDGENAAHVTVHLGKEELMTLNAQEDDSDKPIDWVKKIVFIETFNSRCKTAEGLFPGQLVKEVEKKLGKTKEVMESEIESRQFITFEKEPPHLIFRIDYTGIFDDGSHRSTKFEPNSKILSIAVYR